MLDKLRQLNSKPKYPEEEKRKRLCFGRCLKIFVRRLTRFVGCFISVQCVLSLVILFSLLLMLFSVHIVFDSYSLDNLSVVLKENQRLILDYICHETDTLITQGPNSLEVTSHWLRKQSDIGLMDLDFPNTPFGFFSRESLTIYETKLVHSQTGFHSVGFGGRKGVFLQVQKTEVTEEIYVNQSSLPEECCPYTLSDLEVGTSDDIPGPPQTRIIHDNLTFSEYAYMTSPSHYDFRLETWYKDASGQTSGIYTWSSYLTDEEDHVMMNVALPLYDSDEDFRGVLGVWFDLSEYFTQFFLTATLDEGVIILVDQTNGYLIATSTNSSVYELDENGEKNRVKIDQVDDSVVNGISDYLRNELIHNEFSDHDEETCTYFEVGDLDYQKIKINGLKWYLTGRSLEFTGGLKVLVLYVSQEAVVFSEYRVGRMIGLIMCSTLICIVFFCNCCGVCLFLLPLHKLSREMKKVETMKLDSIRIRMSCCFEIRSLQKKFRYCICMLEEYKSFLPDSIIENTENKPSSSSSSSSSSAKKDEQEIKGGFLKPGKVVCPQDILKISSEQQQQQPEQYQINEEEEEEEDDDESSTTTEKKRRRRSGSEDEERMEMYHNSASGGSGSLGSGSLGSGSHHNYSSKGSSDLGYMSSPQNNRNNKSSSSSEGSEDESISPSTKTYNESIYSLRMNRRNRFGLGIEMSRLIYCAYISIVNWKEVLTSTPQQYNEDYEILLSELKKRISSRGKVLSFKMKEIIIYYENGDWGDSFMSMRNRKTIPFYGLFPFFFGYADEYDEENIKKYGGGGGGGKRNAVDIKRLGNLNFRLVVAITTEYSITGIIGTKRLKHHVIEAGAVEKARKIIKCYKNSRSRSHQYEYSRITVLFDSQSEKEMKDFCLSIGRADVCSHFRPLNIYSEYREEDDKNEYMISNYDDYLVVYEFSIISGKIMTKMKKKKDDVVVGSGGGENDVDDMENYHENLRLGFYFLIHGKYKTARKYLKRSICVGEGLPKRKRDFYNNQRNRRIRRREQQQLEQQQPPSSKFLNQVKYVYDIRAEKLLEIVNIIIQNNEILEEEEEIRRRRIEEEEEEGENEEQIRVEEEEEEEELNVDDLIIDFEGYVKMNQTEVSELEVEKGIVLRNRSLIFTLDEKEKLRKKK